MECSDLVASCLTIFHSRSGCTSLPPSNSHRCDAHNLQNQSDQEQIVVFNLNYYTSGTMPVFVTVPHTCQARHRLAKQVHLP